ncbi:electron transfer flavoprotein beta subunit lysine methyltransferase-like [Calliopsis andreniformis]|uniref:electron transfer flavoprotein beta subunit lysine methyltransferase-like n=1 Tax=Calliopsis andreniformis TaxID=337506 RepID=UPI003FCEDFD7
MITRWVTRSGGLYVTAVPTNRSKWERGRSHGCHFAIEGIVGSEFEVAQTILKHTEVTRKHMTPEIRLFLLTANCSLYHEPFQTILNGDQATKNVFTNPFWSIYWPGGQALARFVLDEGGRLFSTLNKGETNVLDVGAGCGAAAIAAKLVGANKVVANDIDKVACTAISMNAALNHVKIEISQENLLHEPLKTAVDVILIGDMLYDEEIAGSLIPWLQKARKSGSRIYLSDPGRHGLTSDLKKRLKLLKVYPLPDNVRQENYGYDKCNVWEFLG